MDIKTLKLMAENMEEFSDHAYDVASAFIVLNGKHSNYINEIEYYSEVIDISYDASACGCCSDTEHLQMPIEYLWEDGWEEKARVHIEDKQRRQKRIDDLKTLRDEEDRISAKAKKDLTDYKRLKKQFDGEES